MAAARFTEGGRRMAFAAGGQPPAILVSKGNVPLLEARTGILVASSTPRSQRRPKRSNSHPAIVVFYTDGLIEGSTGRKKCSGLRDLKRLSANRRRERFPK